MGSGRDKGAPYDRSSDILRPKVSGVRKPGLPVLPFGVERHQYLAENRAVAIFAGDEITLQDVEGLQPTEVVFNHEENRMRR